MKTPANPIQAGIAALLVLTMIATRPHSLSQAYHVPDTSWATFFLAGFYLRPRLLFPALCLLAGLIDWAAITIGGVSAFCVTPAYLLLVPAYGALWLSGRWAAAHVREDLPGLAGVLLVLVGAATLAELISSGGFYFLGGRFAAPTFAEFLVREQRYFPLMLAAALTYVGVAAVIHALVVATTGRRAATARTIDPWR